MCSEGGGVSVTKFKIKLRNKQTLILVLFFISLLPMGLPQYGGGREMQELPGLFALCSLEGFFAVIVALLGITRIMPSRRLNRAYSILGLFGIVGAEIYTFFTWYYHTIIGEISLQRSLEFSYPEFWLGLAASCAMALIYVLLEWLTPETASKN